VSGRRTAFAALLIILAVLAVLLAADLRNWHSAIRSGDARFATQPALARWTASTTLPGDPAFHLLGLRVPVDLRRAAQRFVQVAALGNGLDNGYSESAQRGDLEATLTNLARTHNRVDASYADNLLGILAFADSQQRGPAGAAPVERSEADFQTAVQLNPDNDDAKFNLELLLRELIAKGVRPGSNSSSGGPAKGHRGAGSGLPGSGY
jgi:hypothetical protein